MVKVLILGKGGREDALGWKLSQEGNQVCIAPGNGGTARFGGEPVPIGEMEFAKLADFARLAGVDLVVVSPDVPLAAGAVDYFQSSGVRAFGPTKAAAQLEASKAFAKKFMVEAGIPTASFSVFDSYSAALQHAGSRRLPFVVKKSGLASGKGSKICHTLDEARRMIHNVMLAGTYGSDGNEVVIEDFLPDREVSIHALCDGKDAVIFPPSQDHKRALDKDQGDMTGGMGAVAPVGGIITPTQAALVVDNTLRWMAERYDPFRGLLYPGVMVGARGMQVLEFNVRFGDPECQAYMRLLKSDVLPLLSACTDGKLSSLPSPTWRKGSVACVVLASGGYPKAFEVGYPIEGVEEAEKIPGVVVFHAGTARLGGKLVTAGGRVLSVTAVGGTLQEAVDTAYRAAKCIRFRDMQYRRDIGQRALAAVK